MKKILTLFLISFLMLPLTSTTTYAMDSSPSVNTSAGKLFGDAVDSIATTTPDLKQQVMQTNAVKYRTLSNGYENASFFGKVMINLSDALNVSISFLMALFWIVGFGLFIISLIYLRDSVELDGDRHSTNYRRKFAWGGLVLAICLMSFNVVIMVLGDTFGVGTQIHNTYDFDNKNVEGNRQFFLGRDGASIMSIDSTTGEITYSRK